MTTNAQTVPLRWFLALALGAAAAAGAGAADAVVVQSAANGYNSWPIVQAIGTKIVCAYSRGTAHDISQGVRGVYARTSTDGGATWGDEVTVANDASCGEVAIGKGLDANGAMLLWVRCWGGANPHHDLYRTTDGDNSQLTAVWGGAGANGGDLPMPRVRVMLSGTAPSKLQIDNVVWRQNLVAGNAYQFSICSTNGETWTAYEDGVATTASSTPDPVNVKAAPLSFGGFTGYSRRLEGTIHTVRVYDRTLSPDEMKANALLDHVRYEGLDPEQAAWPDGFRYFWTDQSLRVRVKIVAQKGCVISVDGGAPVRQFDDWLHRGRDFTVAAFPSSATGSGDSAGTVLYQKTIKADAPCDLTFPDGACNIPASAYSREGLVLHYDGFENAGAGQPHDSTARTWKDLSPSGNDGDLTTSGAFVGNGLDMRKVPGSRYALLTSDSLATVKTMECVIRPSGAEVGKTAAIWGGYPEGGTLPLPRARVNGLSNYASHPEIASTYSFDPEGGAFHSFVPDATIRFAFVANEGESSYTAYVDGETTGVTWPFAGSASRLSFGGFDGYDRRVFGVLSEIRAYDRVLSADELRRHALLDKIRFSSGCGFGYHWDETNRKLQVELEFDCRKRGVVTANGREIGSHGVARIDYGEDAEISVRGKGGKFISWAGDVEGFSEADLASKKIVLHAVQEPRSLVANFTPPTGFKFMMK